MRRERWRGVSVWRKGEYIVRICVCSSFGLGNLASLFFVKGVGHGYGAYALDI